MASKNPKATYMVSTTVSYSRDYYIDHIRGTLLCYCLCWFLSVSPPFFLTFSVQYLLYTPIYLLFTPSSLTFNFLVWYCVNGVKMGGCRRWGGVGSYGWRGGMLWIHAQIYASAWFNVQTRCIITVTSTAPCPTGDWGVELRGSYVSTILQPRLWFSILSLSAHAKWIFPFLLPWFDSVAQK